MSFPTLSDFFLARFIDRRGMCLISAISHHGRLESVWPTEVSGETKGFQRETSSFHDHLMRMPRTQTGHSTHRGLSRLHHFNGVIMGRQRQEFCQILFFIFIDLVSWCMVFRMEDHGSFLSFFPTFSACRDI